MTGTDTPRPAHPGRIVALHVGLYVAAGVAGWFIAGALIELGQHVAGRVLVAEVEASLAAAS